MTDYEVVNPPKEVEVVTVVPHHPEPEFRWYDVPSKDLHLFLSELKYDDHGERVVDVSGTSGWPSRR